MIQVQSPLHSKLEVSLAYKTLKRGEKRVKSAPGLRLLWSFLTRPNCPQMTWLQPRTKFCDIYRQDNHSKPRWDSQCLNCRKCHPVYKKTETTYKEKGVQLTGIGC